ncbi:MAG TPA: Fe-S cluster assembly ATPase SufC [Treponema sp.]|nr:MAG: Fe-S cluster assembly ATPase SufC [Treponema sp. GWA1_62_8]OHE67073.1 MAG: Fe-S cluster assembly ATPase SufC [Treponema sp. GWC1_61_84]OHE75247.1 MAG: Fe-S cluster assembly ATPase SufC [Treponema sp. RIFOXYC1_FULL_61_9]HCM26219.1 Fe-S cluster assembly ATPase SufC [Treponema sp.]
MSFLDVRGLRVAIDSKTILDGLDISVPDGQIHALMGPNGHGKSTLAAALMGHPRYSVLSGTATLDGEDLFRLPVNERARKGLFLAFQYPVEIPGVTVAKFLKRAADLSLRPPESATAFLKELRSNMEFLGIETAFANRYLNDGFSGGEKKRMEILQLLTLKPSFGLFDETDSGLDVDALKIVAAGIERMRGKGFAALLITHYRRLLDLVSPDKVHIMEKGRIAASGGFDLVETLEREGYEGFRRVKEAVHA